MAGFRNEVRKFRSWAAAHDQEDIEWETEYGEDGWETIYTGVREFLSASTPLEWTDEEIEDLLYLLARENWNEIADLLKENPAAACYLAEQALLGTKVEEKSRRQLVWILGYLAPDTLVEELLLRFMDDSIEVVRRWALESLARIGSSHTESFALREWERPHPHQQWARMMALWCWHRSNSPLLETHLREAEVSPLPYLSDYARRLRNGEIKLA